MPYVNKWKCAAWVTAALLAGCSSSPEQTGSGASESKAPQASKDVKASAGAERAAIAPVKLGPPATPRNWNEARLQAARRMVAANPEQTFTGKPPDMLLAIPVLSIELNADGSIKNIDVMRKPSQAADTIEIAKQAIRKAAPFGDISKLPKPWKFNETFLFNNQRKFKPMTLDQL